MTMKGTMLVAAVAGLFGSVGGAAMADDSKGGDEVICSGINACKGHGSCAGPGHACAGKNGCKGQGHTKTSKQDCLAKGGKVVEKK